METVISIEKRERAELESVAKAIHEGLGGSGWAYANYGGDEWNDCREQLLSAAKAALESELVRSMAFELKMCAERLEERGAATSIVRETLAAYDAAVKRGATREATKALYKYSELDKFVKQLEKKYIPKDVIKYGGTCAAVVKAVVEQKVEFKWSFK